MAEEFLSQRAYAAHRGVAEQAVAKAIRTGRLSKSVEHLENGTKRINVTLADKEWAENTFEGNVRKDGDSIIDEKSEEDGPTDSDGLSYSRSRAIRETIQVKMAAFELDRKMGRYVEVDKVRVEWFNVARTVRNALLGIPDRMAPILASERDPEKCHELLTHEIVKVLENLAANAK